MGIICRLDKLTFILIVAGSAYPQSTGRTGHDTVRELSRIDTNRAVELQIMSPAKNNAARAAIQKQVSDDFRDLQSLHNTMMAKVWTGAEIDYRYISDMISQISKKARRLKSNLGLPEVKDEQDTKDRVPDISTTQDFKTELLALDRSVMSFVANSIFQRTTVVKLEQAQKAARDLDAVMDRSERLKKIGKEWSKLHR
jgi:hypothetical protein